jgi:hypothetical protein
MNSFKKIFMLSMVSLIGLTPVASFAKETKFSMELWNRWTMEQVDGETTQNEMALKRGYFRLEPKITDNIKGRFNLDFFSNDEGDGAGIKLKYAYLEFKELIPVSETKVYAGLIKNYFGTIYDWDYTTIEKDPSDKYKFSSSTDYGMAFYGYLPQGYGEYSFSVINGEGYKKTGDDLNTSMGMLANVRVTPIPGLTVGASYLMNSKNMDEEYEATGTDDDGNEFSYMTNDREDWNSIALMGKYAKGPLMVMGEYLTQTTSYEAEGAEDVTKTAMMGMAKFAMKNYLPLDVDLIGRYDMFDPNTDGDDDGSSLLLLGANYNVVRDSKGKPQVMVQVNYELESEEEEGTDDVSTIMAQLRWKFSHKFK